jgi:hypothetical protein
MVSEKIRIKTQILSAVLPTVTNVASTSNKQIRITKTTRHAKAMTFFKDNLGKITVPADSELTEIANAANHQQRDTIVGIDLILPEKLVSRIEGLMLLKNSQKTNVVAGNEDTDKATNFWVELREVEYDSTKGIIDAAHRIKITSASDTTTVSGKITLTGKHSDDAKRIIIINPSNINATADPVTYVVETSLILDKPRDALLALEDKIDEMEEHYTKDNGDLSRNIDADLNFLKDYNGTAATSDQQKVYAITKYATAVNL